MCRVRRGDIMAVYSGATPLRFYPLKCMGFGVLSISFVYLTRPHPSAFLLTDCELLSGTWSSRTDVGRLRRLFDV